MSEGREETKEFDVLCRKAQAWEVVNKMMDTIDDQLMYRSFKENDEQARHVAHLIRDIRSEGLKVVLELEECGDSNV